MKTRLSNFIITLFLLLAPLFVWGQRPIEIMVNLAPPYPLEIDEYINNYPNYMVTIINHTFNEQSIYIHAELIGDNGKGVDVNDNYRPNAPLIIGAKEVLTLTGSDIEILNDNITTDDITTIGFSEIELALGILPEGNYEFCLSAFDWTTSFPMTTGCSFEFASSFGETPFIITPMEDEEVLVQDPTTFPITWETGGWIPEIAVDFEYEVKIVDLTEYADDDLEDLFSDNGVASVLEGFVMNNRYLYGADGSDPPLIEGHRYGIRIRVIDPFNLIEFQNGEYSEIRTFTYGEPLDDGSDPFDDMADLDLPEADDCASRCEVVLPENLNISTTPASFQNLYIGYFELVNIAELTETNGKWNGIAELKVPFLNNLRMDVTLDTITVNTNGQIIGGMVNARDEDGIELDGPFLDQFKFVEDGWNEVEDLASNTPYTENIAADASKRMGEFLMEHRMITGLLGANSVGFPVGKRQAIAGNEFVFGITDLKIVPTGAKVKIIAGADLKMFPGDNWLMFGGEEVCFHPQGFGGEYTLGLGADLVFQKTDSETGSAVQTDNSLALYLKGGENVNPIDGTQGGRCEIKMTCDGISSFDLVGEVRFPKNRMAPKLADGTLGEEKVKGTFNLTLDRVEGDSTTAGLGSNWLINMDVERFEIRGLKNWTFEIDQAYLDLSAIENAPEINFPMNYHTKDETFEGVYLKSGFISPPDDIALTDSSRVVISDLIIDPKLWVNIDVRDVLDINDGAIDGWRISIAELGIDIENNELIDGSMTGLMHIPVLADTTFLDYTASITNTYAQQGGTDDNWEFNFTVSPSTDVQFPVFIADATIFDDTNIEINWDLTENNNSYINAEIHGNLNIDTEEHLPESIHNLAAAIKFKGMDFGIGFHSKFGIDDSPDKTFVALASDQKFFGGFPVSISGFDLEGGAESLDFGFDLEVNFGGSNEDLSAGARFVLESNLKLADVANVADGADMNWQGAQSAFNNTSALVKKFDLDNVRIDSVFFDVTISKIRLEGNVGFYNDALEGGGSNQGTRGDLTVTLPMGIQGKLEGEFGTYGELPVLAEGTPLVYSEDYFSYWRVDASILLPPPYIKFGALPLGIIGFGGGVYKNMSRTPGGVTFEDGIIQGVNEYEVSSETFDNSGFEVKVMFGITEDISAFNADLSFAAEINPAGGLDQFTISGDGYVMTPPDERANPKMQVGFNVTAVLSEDDGFDLNGEMYVLLNFRPEEDEPSDFILYGNMENAPRNNTFVQAYFHANKDDWFFRMGAPWMDFDEDDPRGSAHMEIANIINVDLKTYLMVGSEVPTALPPLPREIQAILNNPSGDASGAPDATAAQAVIDESAAATGRGFAHGLSVEIVSEIDAYLLYASLNVYMGYDLNLTKWSEPCSNTGQIPGINGYYAQGQIYAGLEGGMGIRFKFLGKNRDFNLFYLRAAMALSGGGPKPFYFQGQASVYYEIWDGKISGQGSFIVKAGEPCVPQLSDPFAGINFYEKIDPEQNERNVFVGKVAMVKLALPIDQVITIPTPVVDDDDVITGMQNTYYTPRLSWSIKKPNGSNVSLSHTWQNNSNKEQLNLVPNQVMGANRWHELHLSVTAHDHQTRRNLVVDGRQWSQDTIIRFKTGEMPQDLYPFVRFSKPLEMERHYLQHILQNSSGDGSGGIYLSSAVPRDHYFPRTNVLGGEYEYVVKYTNLNSGQSEEIQMPNNIFSSPYVDTNIREIGFRIPNLENSTLYALQIIRRGELVTDALQGTQNQDGTVTRSIAEFESDGLSTIANLTNQAIEPPGQSVGRDETLLYHTYFRTSRYNTVTDKMNDFDSSVDWVTGYSQYGNRLEITYSSGEPWEKRAFSRFKPFNPALQSGNVNRYQKRMELMDPFQTSYHNYRARKLETFVNNYEDNVRNYLIDQDIPSNLILKWGRLPNGGTSYSIPNYNLSGSFANPLSLNEVQSVWNDYLEEQGIIVPSSGNLNGQIITLDGFSYSSHRLKVIYDTPYKVSQDRKTLLDWISNYEVATSVLPTYARPHSNPSWVSTRNALMNVNTKLTNSSNNHYQYKVNYLMNMSKRPNEFDWNIFDVYQFYFNVPAPQMNVGGSTSSQSSNFTMY